MSVIRKLELLQVARVERPKQLRLKRLRPRSKGRMFTKECAGLFDVVEFIPTERVSSLIN